MTKLARLLMYRIAEGLDEPIDVDLQDPELPDPAPSAPDNTPSVDFDDWGPTLF